MGLTTSCEAIKRHASPVASVPGPEAPDTQKGVPTPSPGSNTTSAVREDVSSHVTCSGSPKGAKRSSAGAGPPKKKRKPRTPSKTAGKGISIPKKTPIKQSSQSKSFASSGCHHDGPESPIPEAAALPQINAHRARLLVGKQALAAVREGTRIYIKSGEGNGGDTWWDSGIIQKIHERGKPFEVKWQGTNNRGEEVDTGVEKRIGLLVTYSLAAAAAEAILGAEPGTENAALARKSVLAKARIGSWCIDHPEEPWGKLDPFGEDSSLVSGRL